MSHLSWAVLYALVLIGRADPELDCSNYLNSTTYHQAVGRWEVLYVWSQPGARQHTKNNHHSITFNTPTTEDIYAHRNPPVPADELTPHPKLLVNFTSSVHRAVLLDISDKITVVKGYYDRIDTEEVRLRRIGEFVVAEDCEVGRGRQACVCSSGALAGRGGAPESRAAQAAACVEEKDYIGRTL